MSAFEYQRFIDPDDDAPFRDVVWHALNIPHDTWPTFAERMGREYLRVARHNGRLIGGLGTYPMGQWFGGRPVRCAGVAAVGVAPEYRRQGVSRGLLQSMLEEQRAARVPIAALYPSSQAVYRAVGFEQAGSWHSYKLPLPSIRVNDREMPVQQAPLTSPEPFAGLCRQRAESSNGQLERTPGLWQRILNHRQKPQYGYLVGDADAPEGFLIYFQDGGVFEESKIEVRDLHATTARAGRRLWTFLADHASIVSSVAWRGPAVEPLLALVGECKFTPVEVFRWMLRIVDVERALAARGYPGDVSVELHFDVTDGLLPANTGRYVLEIQNGTAEVRRGGRGDLRCDVQGLAPLYSALYSPQTLKTLGWLDGPDHALRDAARVFAGPEPWMPEIF
jgi:predicted acetyltransferase